jgi:hypothetical protein
MPRSSPYVIVLTDQERAHLEATARRYTSPHRDVLRARIVLYAAQGLRNDEIAARLDTHARSCPNGANASTSNVWQDWPMFPGADGHRVFPPEVVVAIKALACELPATAGVPLARWHCQDLAHAAIDQGIVASISDTTVWRWLSADAIKPWQHRSWIFPRDPDFATKAARVLDLYHRRWKGRKLCKGDYVVCADEKTSIQARLPQTSHSPARSEAGDAGGARVHPRRRVGLSGRLGRPPRQDLRPLRAHHRHRTVQPAGRPSHGRRAVRLGLTGVLARGQRLISPRPGVHRPAARTLAPTAADPPAGPRLLAESGRDLLLRRPAQSPDPNDFADLEQVEARLLAFQGHYEQIATPFEWKFTRNDLNALLARTTDQTLHSAA